MKLAYDLFVATGAALFVFCGGYILWCWGWLRGFDVGTYGNRNGYMSERR
jgi:hypothetical protein